MGLGPVRVVAAEESLEAVTLVLTPSGGGGVRGVLVDVLLELGLRGGQGRVTQEGRGYRVAEEENRKRGGNVDVSKRRGKIV